MAVNRAPVPAPKLCTTCGVRYPADALFCPNDGTPLSTSAAAEAAQYTGPDAPDPYLGREILDHIEVRQLAGVGAMGRVYRAFQRGIDRDVAVKILHRELSSNQQLVTRFHREAKVASRLQHPNVVQVHLAGQLPDGAMYIVMEYLDGLSLQSALAAAGGSMPLPRALHIGLQLCDATGEGHSQGVVHRDLKPENVMLIHRGDDNDYVKVLDFGIARLSWGEQSMATAAGLIFGTARYISPEGAQGEGVVPASDVYAIATLVYQMLSGRTPFEGEQAVALLIQQIHDPPPHLRSIPRAAYVPEPIAAAIMRNLVKKPKDRDPEARAFGRALLEAAVESGLSAEDLVPRSMFLAGRASGPVRLAPMQRTRQLAMQPERDAFSSAPELLREPTPSPGFGAVLARPASTPSSPALTPLPSSASLRASAVTPKPSGVDITLDDNSETPAPHFNSTSPWLERPAFPEVAPREPSRTGTERPPPEPDDDQGDEAELMGGRLTPRAARSRAAVVVFFCFLFGVVIAAGVAFKFHLLGGGRSASESIDETISRSNDALRRKRWDGPPGDNVRDLTTEGLSRWPNNSALLELRERASAELVNEAVGRHFAGELNEAVRLARLASELDPADTTAVRLVEQYEGEASRASSTTLPSSAPANSASPPLRVAPTPRSNPGPLYRVSLETAASPRSGQPVNIAAKLVPMVAGLAPKVEDTYFQLRGPGIADAARVDAAGAGNGPFEAAFTFPEAGKFELSFNAKVDGVAVRSTKSVVAAPGTQGPTSPRPSVPAPPGGADAGLKWL